MNWGIKFWTFYLQLLFEFGRSLSISSDKETVLDQYFQKIGVSFLLQIAFVTIEGTWKQIGIKFYLISYCWIFGLIYFGTQFFVVPVSCCRSCNFCILQNDLNHNCCYLIPLPFILIDAKLIKNATSWWNIKEIRTRFTFESRYL